MRNILTIDTKKTPYEFNYCNEGNCHNEIELDIYISELINPYLEITKQDGTIENTDILEINDNRLSYIIPFDTYKTNGSLSIRVMDDDYESDYIQFTISDSLNTDDDIIVKLQYNNYLIKKYVSNNFSILDMYPVGSIYMSVNNVNPSNMFGGTWEQIKDKFLLSVGDTYTKSEAEGGSATHTHTYSHTHGVPGVAHSHGYGSLYAAMANAGTSGHFYKSKTGISFTPNEYKKDTGAGYTTTTKQTEGIQVYGNTGSTTPSSTTTNSQSTTTTSSSSSLPPYLTVYMWKRTA